MSTSSDDEVPTHLHGGIKFLSAAVCPYCTGKKMLPDSGLFEIELGHHSTFKIGPITIRPGLSRGPETFCICVHNENSYVHVADVVWTKDGWEVKR